MNTLSKSNYILSNSFPTLLEIFTLMADLNTSPAQDLNLYNVVNNGFHGVNIWNNGEFLYSFQISAATNGQFVVYKNNAKKGITIYDFYNSDGNLAFSDTEFYGSNNQLDDILFHHNIFFNFLYKTLNAEYTLAKSALALTKKIETIESILSNFEEKKLFPETLAKRNQNILQTFLTTLKKNCNETTLTWEERRQLNKKTSTLFWKAVATKQRAHRKTMSSYKLNIRNQVIVEKTKLFFRSLIPNLIGYFFLVTVGNFIWFINTVKNNLGYSVALAIYGPFTFYFITQPMNPHAMWAVGKVREAYINITNQNYQKQQNDKLDEVVFEKPTQIAPVRSVDWTQRMDSFKAFQINFEGNLVFAARMGRMEQIESQLNFPLTALEAWESTKYYLGQVDSTLKYNKNLGKKLRSYLNSEKEKSIKILIYIWKKLNQFYLDHPYILLDKENKQTSRSKLILDQFTTLQSMTGELRKMTRDEQITLPRELLKIFKPLKYSPKITSEMNRLGNISIKNIPKESKRLRSSDSRHWEVLFLQQNKKQEASSFGLQTYTFSIRNTLWILQSIMQIKLQELPQLTYSSTQKKSIYSNNLINSRLTKLFHMLSYDFISIYPELKSTLESDTEIIDKNDLISLLSSSFKMRQSLFKDQGIR